MLTVITRKRLAEILTLHRAWLLSQPGGQRADLGGANLGGANLGGANLGGANLTGVVLERHRIVPEVGAFECFKSLYGGHVAHLRIPAEAARVGGLVGRKCRAEFADVLSVVDSDGAFVTDAVQCRHDGSFTYTAGARVTPDAWDGDERVECTNGIHFFLTLREAEEYC